MCRRAALACVVTGACSFSSPRASAPDGDDAPDGGGATEEGLVAWYEMDQPAGGTVEDATGRGHDGTCGTCPAVVPGRLGTGARFGAPNARIDVPSAPDLRLTSGFTISLWLSFDALPSSEYSCAVNKLLGTSISNSWQLCYRLSNKGWFFGTQTAGGFDALETPASPTIDTWYHLAISWDGTTKRLWSNGSPIDEGDARDVVFDDARITIGADIDNGQHRNAFPGIVDDVRIYNRALAPAEIARLANP